MSIHAQFKYSKGGRICTGFFQTGGFYSRLRRLPVARGCWLPRLLRPPARPSRPSPSAGRSTPAGIPTSTWPAPAFSKRWADKYGVVIKVQRFDYAASLDAFVAKNIDACTMTNMEALDMPAAAGVDSTAVIIGDYSNGNDAVLARNNLTLAQLAGKPILLVQKTVSEYLLERAMDMNGLDSQLGRLKLLNTSDSDIVGAFLGEQGQPGGRDVEAAGLGDSRAGFRR